MNIYFVHAMIMWKGLTSVRIGMLGYMGGKFLGMSLCVGDSWPFDTSGHCHRQLYVVAGCAAVSIVAMMTVVIIMNVPCIFMTTLVIQV